MAFDKEIDMAFDMAMCRGHVLGPCAGATRMKRRKKRVVAGVAGG